MPETSLHVASANGHAQIVQLLLKNGSKPDICNQNGKTALDLARAGGHGEVERLLEQAAEVRSRAQRALVMRSAPVELTLSANGVNRRPWADGNHATPVHVTLMGLALKLHHKAGVEAAAHRRDRHAPCLRDEAQCFAECGDSDD